MTFAVREEGGTSEETSAVTTHTVSLDGSISADDILLISLGFNQDPGTITWSGYTEIAKWNESVACHTAVFAKAASGSEGSTDTFTTGNSTISSHVYIRYSGGTVPTSSEIATVNELVVDANPPSLTPPGGSDDITWIAGYNRSDDRRSTGDPSQYSNFQSIDNGGSSGVETGNSDRQNAVATEDPPIFGFNGGAENTCAYTCAIYPAGAAPAAVYPPFPRRQLTTVRM